MSEFIVKLHLNLVNRLVPVQVGVRVIVSKYACIEREWVHFYLVVLLFVDKRNRDHVCGLQCKVDVRGYVSARSSVDFSKSNTKVFQFSEQLGFYLCGGKCAKN